MPRGSLIEERLTGSVIGASYEVYNQLGFGFLEHVYVMALERELRSLEHNIAREVGVTVRYKGDEVAVQRLDMVVDDKVIVEVKSTYELHRAAPPQLFNCLRATRFEVGLLLHFGPEPKFHRLISSNHPMKSVRLAPSAGSG